MRFDNMIPGASRYIPTPRKHNRKEKGMSYKIVVKDGDTRYASKNGTYVAKTVDRVEKYDDLSTALADFLYYTNDEFSFNKVSLTYVPSKKKGNK